MISVAVLLRQLKTLVRRGVLKLVDADYFCQVEGFNGERTDDVELWQQYGLASRPPAGSEVLYVKPGLTGDTALIIVTQHRSSRPSGLKEKESALYSEHGGQVLCAEDGDVDLTAKSGQTVNVGGDSEALAKGETLKTALDAFCTTVGAVTGGSTAQNAAAITAIAAAANTLKTALSSVLASKGKVS